MNCPYCKSSYVTRVTWSWVSGVIGPALFPEYKCQSCRMKFKVKDVINALNSKNSLHSANIDTSINKISIPDTCPHCKNPNSKKIRLCEWCGNQIC